MVEVVINKRIGGFGISSEAVEYIRKIGFSSEVRYYLKERCEENNRIVALTEAGGRSWRTAEKCDDPFDLSDDELSSIYEGFRSAPELIKTVKKLGKGVNKEFADLKVVEVPNDVKWHIENYDGDEKVVENRRSWS